MNLPVRSLPGPPDVPAGSNSTSRTAIRTFERRPAAGTRHVALCAFQVEAGMLPACSVKGTWLPTIVAAGVAGLWLTVSTSGLQGADAAPAPTTPPPATAAAQPKDPAEELAELFAKEESITNTLGMVMVWLPDAKYRVAQFEVTQAWYETVMGANPSKFSGATRPVENVSCLEAAEFCRKLTEKEQSEAKLPKNFAYQLPTEAEWELYVNETPLNTAIVSLIGDRPWTENVGLLPPNKLGLHDVRGNVWEWCANAVARGGSYQSHEDYLGIGFRFAGTPDLKMEDIGFRVLLKETGPR